jgi:hypothetical protein
MTKEELQAQIESLGEQYRAKYQVLANEMLLLQWGVSIGATLINDDGQEFVVEEIKYSDSTAQARKLKGTIIQKNSWIEVSEDNPMGWRAKV